MSVAYFYTSNMTLTNCEISPKSFSTSMPITTQYFSFTVTANDGYIFKQAPTNLNFKSTSPSGETVSFATYSLSSDKKTYTVKFPSSRYNYSDTIRFNSNAVFIAEEEITSVPVTNFNEISNTTIEFPTENFKPSTEYVYTVKANNYYQITNATLTIYDNDDTVIDSITNNTGVFTYTTPSELTSSAYKVVITGSTVIGYADCKSTSTITNATIKITGTIRINTNNNFSVTALDGYKITSATLKIYNANNPTDLLFNETNNTGDFVVNPASLSYTNYVADFTATVDIVTSDDISVEYNNSFSNASVENPPSTINILTDNTFTIKADNGYIFQFAPTFTLTAYPKDGTATTIYDSATCTKVDDNTYTFTIPSNTLLNTYSYVSIRIVGNAYSVTRPCTVYNELSHITYAPTIGNTLSIIGKYTLTFTADNGYYITTLPNIDVFNSQVGDVISKQATLIDDYTAQIEFTIEGTTIPSDSTFSVTLTGTASVETEISATYPFLQVFSLTPSQITDLNNARFVSVTVEGTASSTTITENDVDLGNYIIQMFKTFYSVSTENTENVKLGTVDTEVTGALISSRIKQLETNEITIENIYNNSIDYESEVKIFIPFYGFYSCDSFVIGHKVKLQYKIENATGEGYCYIVVDDDIIDSVPVTCKLEFPYDKSTSDSINIANAISSKDNLSIIPYIIIVYNNVFSNNFASVNTFDSYEILSSLKGYIEGDCNILTIDENYIYNTEKDEIKNIITNGVII